MPFVFNGTTLTSIYFNDTEIDTAHFNGTEVYTSSTPIPTTRLGCWYKSDGVRGDTTWRTKTLSNIGSTYNGRTAKLVFVYRSHTSGTTYRGDIQVDRVRYGGTTFDFDTGEAWQKETSITNNNLIGTYATRLGAGKTAIGTSVSNGYWSRDANATGSSETGGATAVYGGYCLYPETSGSVLGDYFWAESPEFTYNENAVRDIIIAMEGVSCGTLAVYIIDSTTTDFTPSISGGEAYNPTPTNWNYLGTSGTYNLTSTYQNGLFCASSGDVDTWLTSNYPPGNYEVGDLMRVTVKTSSGGSCGYMFFEAEA